jgi:hypothetical protein
VLVHLLHPRAAGGGAVLVDALGRVQQHRHRPVKRLAALPQLLSGQAVAPLVDVAGVALQVGGGWGEGGSGGWGGVLPGAEGGDQCGQQEGTKA